MDMTVYHMVVFVHPVAYLLTKIGSSSTNQVINQLWYVNGLTTAFNGVRYLGEEWISQEHAY